KTRPTLQSLPLPHSGGVGAVMDTQTIVVRGAREHNLRDVHLELPRNKLIVFTGVSGSGKSSLAFDTIYAEGQRRYVESLSSYVRARVDGQLVKLTDDLRLDKRIKHTIEIVIDRLKADPKVRPRLAEAVEQALALAEGNLIVSVESEEASGAPASRERERPEE